VPSLASLEPLASGAATASDFQAAISRPRAEFEMPCTVMLALMAHIISDIHERLDRMCTSVHM
jgi:hypothetical protein